jgi:uroporphyrinogen III methyltransferase/synthase
MTGKVWLVGAGPGDRGLFTLKGLEVLQNAEVVVHDALIGDEVLTLIPEDAVKINVGKRASHHRMEQEQINRTLLEEAQAGKRVVRLKGGDPFLFGRGGEELELLAENNIPFEVVPGVTSAFAVPAYNGIPVTHRDFTSSVHIITGHRRASKGPDVSADKYPAAGTGTGTAAEKSGSAGTATGTAAEKSGSAGAATGTPEEKIGSTGAGPGDADSLGIDYEALVRTHGTLIFLMGLSNLPAIMKGLLLAGIDPDLPAAVLERGTTARQKRVLATVSTLEEEAARSQIQAPAIIVVGEVCRLADSFAWAEKRPLAGKKILLTRPKELISEMAVRLRRAGAEVLEMPAIETVPIEPNPALDRKMAELRAGDKRPDWIIFTSPSGVRIFMERLLSEQDIRVLAGIKIAVIGEGSAKKLRTYGIRADFMPSVYDGETLGRELARKIRQESAEAELQKPAEEKIHSFTEENVHYSAEETLQKSAEPDPPVRILIPRAAIGNPELTEELQKAGNVEISDIAIYDTRYVSPELIDVPAQIRKGEIDYAVFTSASTVRGFSAVMKDTDLSGFKAICIGRQTRAAAEARGMETRMAEKATLDALVEAVMRCAAETTDGRREN